MFRNKMVEEHLKQLDEAVFGKWQWKDVVFGDMVRISLEQRIKNLETENKKLKAIVAELCDYVYRDQQEQK